MLICVYYDQFNAAAVNKINELKGNPKFGSGSFSFDGCLDSLAATTGFVCYRCKEEFSVESEKNHEQCWIFELKKGVEEYTEVMAILYQAKLHSNRTANSTRSLIELSRVMCDSCKRLERPLAAEYATTVPTQFEIEPLDVKPLINKTTRRIEVANNDVYPAEISNVHNESYGGPIVGANQTVQAMEEVETKPLPMNIIKQPAAPVQPTASNAREPLSEMLQRQSRMQESSQEENHLPITSSSHAVNSALNRNNLMNAVFGASQVKREICEAHSSQQNASYLNDHIDQTRISATPVREALMNPSIFHNTAHVNPTTSQEAQPAVVEQPVADSTTTVENPRKRKSNGADHLFNSFISELPNIPEPCTSMSQNDGDRLNVTAPAQINQYHADFADYLRMVLNRTTEQTGPTASSSNGGVLPSYSASAVQSSRVLDSKQNILVPASVSETQPTSHFDSIVAEPTGNVFAHMNFQGILNGRQSETTSQAVPRPRNPTDLMNPAGHSHWAKPDLIRIGVVEGFLPIYKVNHNTTQFHPVRISDLNSSSTLLFHASLLKRKTEEWIKVQVTSSTELSDGICLNYNHEVFRKPGQMRKATKPLKLCCDSLLHFILIHTDDLRYR